MVTIGSNGQRIAYGIKHYNLDDESDLQNINVRNEKMGCTCFIISTSKYYMLNSRQQWIEITPFGKAVASNTDMDGDGIPDSADPSIDIVYEGGSI
jgi:hypothetical protein